MNLSFIFAIYVLMSVDVPVRQLFVVLARQLFVVLARQLSVLAWKIMLGSNYIQNSLKTFYLLFRSCCIHIRIFLSFLPHMFSCLSCSSPTAFRCSGPTAFRFCIADHVRVKLYIQNTLKTFYLLF